MPNLQTKTKIDNWIRLLDKAESLKGDLALTETALHNAVNQLGAHITPDDAAPDEVFCVWVTESEHITEPKILTVTKQAKGMTDYKIEWRKEKR